MAFLCVGVTEGQSSFEAVYCNNKHLAGEAEPAGVLGWDHVAVNPLCSLLKEWGSLSKSDSAVVPVLLPGLVELPL